MYSSMSNARRLGLPSLWGGEQGAFPWRGRITCDPAPGMAGSVDATAAASAQIAAFLGDGEDVLNRLRGHG